MAQRLFNICQTKMRYDSLEQAKEVAAQMRNSTGYVLVGYRCLVCRAFHVGGESRGGYRKKVSFRAPEQKKKVVVKEEKKTGTIRGMEAVQKLYAHRGK